MAAEVRRADRDLRRRDAAEELDQIGYDGIRAQYERVAAEVVGEGEVRSAGKVFWVRH